MKLWKIIYNKMETYIIITFVLVCLLAGNEVRKIVKGK